MDLEQTEAQLFLEFRLQGRKEIRDEEIENEVEEVKKFAQHWWMVEYKV